MAGQSDAMIEKMQLRQSYRNVWHTDLTNAIVADVPCAYSTSCDSFFSFSFPPFFFPSFAYDLDLLSGFLRLRN
jgi:hypothetical protein